MKQTEEYGKILRLEELVNKREEMMRLERFTYVNEILTPEIEKIKREIDSIMGRQINCQICVPSYWARMNGFNVEPKPLKNVDDSPFIHDLMPNTYNRTYTSRITDRWCWNSGLFYVDSTGKAPDIWTHGVKARDFPLDGDGTYEFIHTLRDGDFCHTVVYTASDDVIHDIQSGENYPMSVYKTFVKWDTADYEYNALIRLDGCDINWFALEKWVEVLDEQTQKNIENWKEGWKGVIL